MALSDYQKKVLDDGASAYWPLDDPSGTVARDLFGTSTASEGVVPCIVTVNGTDITTAIRYGSLNVGLAINEEPDTASFEVVLTSNVVEGELYPGSDVLITLAGEAIFGGRILTIQTTRGPARGPSVRSVFCTDYLQVLDSEYLVTYGWPAQSATTTINDLIQRFANRSGGLAVTTLNVYGGLPSHAAFGVANERVSTVLRRIVTQFPTGGGFYIDPLKDLHAWEGASEPGTNPATVTLDSPQLKTFAETLDNSQQRDAVIVEGLRTTAPIGTPGPDPLLSPNSIVSLPVVDASIFDQIVGSLDREVRIGTQRYIFAKAEGAWSSPAGAPTSSIVTVAAAFNPDPGVEANTVTLWIKNLGFLSGRTNPFVRINEQWLKVLEAVPADPPPQGYVKVPRTGYGAMTGPIAAEAVVTVADSLVSGAVTDRYNKPMVQEQVRPQPIDAEVVMTVRSKLSTNSVHEHLVQDGRFSRDGATGRGQQEVQDFKQALISIDFETDDLLAKPGRLQAYDLAEPVVTHLAGQYMILSAALTWPVWGLAPRRVCHGAKVTAARVIDAWLVDRR